MEDKLEEALNNWRKGNFDHCLSTLEEFAKKGVTEAQRILGQSYSTDSWGQTKDMSKAIAWYKLAADNGDVYANLELALLFDPNSLLESEKNKELSSYYYKETIDLCELGVELGDAEMMYLLSVCYNGGFGVQHSQETAIKLLKKSCEEGYDLACNELRDRETPI